ncbi:AbrB/MazE/SpoVT family DNA-binding domain-containing protein [Mitsuaria sp. GD03876]|uniref:AbrB/MazE/SpoVT family DNA-binding domain-containing protein n=1 Tax=Mitsuaria sp. GD03876 TaxID=2975399 RepID=UPI0024483223|nr:AbrB/MazE/SpoVT family DNA-binding domain-containing protein [Mitsuaria sp. GD03876]MDH0865799.1 AbrB/MazE/SpoVT family DNA-binding domain-containing protein [Mitsuaria sp. GD03876]
MNGRIVIPKDIRKAVGAKLGTRFIWELQEDGSIRVLAKTKRPRVEELPPDSEDPESGETDI